MRKGEMKGGKLTPALNVVVLLANLSPLHLERERLDVKLGKEAVVDEGDTCERRVSIEGKEGKGRERTNRSRRRCDELRSLRRRGHVHGPWRG
jgi:hypothetical protein